MLVSCICLTYNRCPSHQFLLEECIESFLRQDYEEKELIILNDTPRQYVRSDAKGVIAINESCRFKTLGEKYNFAISCSTGELICGWEDDDISLPWRLSYSVEALGDFDYYNPQGEWYMTGSGLHWEHNQGCCHASSIFRRSAWEQVGGYPAVSGPQDQQFDGLLRSKCRTVKNPPLPKENWYYIYRWGVSPVHLSGHYPHDEFYEMIGAREIEEGDFFILPGWRKDYVALCEAKLEEAT